MDISSSKRLWPLVLLAIAIAVTIWLYLPVLSTMPFWDDYGDATSAVIYGWDVFSDKNVFFRPLERLINATNTKLAPGVWAWSHSVSLLFLVVSGLALWRLLLSLFPSAWMTAALAGAVFMLHPAMVNSVVQIDTVSQLMSAMFAVIAMLCLARTRNPLAVGHLVTIGVLTLLGMLSKEGFAGFAAGIPIIAVVLHARLGPVTRGQVLRWLLAYAVTFAVAFAIYTALRFASGRGFGSNFSRYEIEIGFNLIKNTAMLLGAGLFPGSTVKLLHNRDVLHIAISLLPVLLAVGVLLLGLRHWLRGDRHLLAGSQRSRSLAIVALILAMLAGLVPSILVQGVSEHQASLPLPFLVALVLSLAGFAVAALRRAPLPWAALLGTCVAASLVWMVFATNSKITLFGHTAARAEAITAQIMTAFAAAPPDAAFVVCHTPPEDERMFGVYDLPADAIIGTLVNWHMAPIWPDRDLRQAPAGDPACSVTIASAA